MWALTLPTVDEAPAMWGQRLMERVRIARGISLLEGPPGTWRAVRFPTQDEIRAAETFFQGGYQYEVDDDTKDALLASDVGLSEDDFTTPLTAYGGGGYGEGLYGG